MILDDGSLGNYDRYGDMIMEKLFVLLFDKIGYLEVKNG